MSDTPMDVSNNPTVSNPIAASPSGVGIKRPQYMLNQPRQTGPGIHNKPGIDTWAGSAFSRKKTDEILSQNTMMPTQTYQNCECETCRNQNLQCSSCPQCQNGTDAQTEMSEYDEQVGKTYDGCGCATCKELNVNCDNCPECKSNNMKGDCCPDLNKQAPCWEGYVMRGMKPGANGKPVPNCVPSAKADDLFEDDDTVEYDTDSVSKADGYSPPAGARSAARRAIKFKEDGKANGAGTSVGWTRAGQLARGETISLSTVKRMYSYFSRHEVDKKGKDWGNSTNPSNGYIMWLAWGGDAGFSWSRSIVNREKDKALFSDFGKEYSKYKTKNKFSI